MTPLLVYDTHEELDIMSLRGLPHVPSKEPTTHISNST
jgi:hypothetical protein